MIKANELRIGNCVFALFNSCTIKEVFENGISIEFKSGKRDIEVFDHIKPIPLTPEILESCGFKCNKDFGIYSIPNLSLDTDFYYVHIDYEGTHDRIIHITYLHQLQNLYFALIGKELEVNLLMENNVSKC